MAASGKKFKVVLKTTYKKFVLQYQVNTRLPSWCLASEKWVLSYIFTQKRAVTQLKMATSGKNYPCSEDYRRLLRIRPPDNPPMRDLLETRFGLKCCQWWSARGEVLAFGMRWLIQPFVRGYPVQGWTGVISGQGILVACAKPWIELLVVIASWMAVKIQVYWNLR